MPRYNNGNDRENNNFERQTRQTRTTDTAQPTTSSRGFRADLEDLVVDSNIVINKTNPQVARLDRIFDEFDEFLVKSLASKFKMSEDDARALGSMDDRIKYMEKNSWKLKIPEFAPVMDEANALQMEMRKQEADIRAELDEVLAWQEKISAKNDELLKEYHQQLMEDAKKAEDLEIENAGLLATIPDIADSQLYQEVVNLKETIDKKYADIDGIREKIENKENDNIAISKEIDEIDNKIRNEMADVAKLTRDKQEIDREVLELNRELAAAKKNGTPEEIKELEDRIKDKNNDRKNIVNQINDKNNTINTYREDKGKKISLRTDNLTAINTLNNEKRDLRSSLEQNEKDHRIKLAELTKERDEDSEEVRKYKRNLKEIELLNIDSRKDEYQEKKSSNAKFKNELDENRRNINDKFREYKLESPTNTKAGKAAAAIAMGEGGASEQAQQAAGAQAKGGAPVAGGGAGSSALVPADMYRDLTDKQLANNFYNDVVNKHCSPLEMQLKLSGFGFSTFVNACEHLSPRQRKKILPILRERRVRLASTAADEAILKKVLGPDIYKLVYDSSTRAPRSLNDLSEEEIRRLSIAAEDFNRDLVKFSDDDIKIIESKFFDVLANSAVVDMYEQSSTLKGRLTGWFDNLRNKQKVQVVKELRGTMCQYHREKVDRFYLTDSRERKFKDILGRDTVREPVKSQINANVPDLTRGQSALRQEANDRLK